MRAIRIASIACAICFVAGVVSAAAPADDYPGRPLRIIVPFTAGSGPDVVARLIGQKLLEAWGQAVVVDNRAGASGTIAGELVARASPDGYTLLMASPSLTITAALSSRLPYDFVRDFAPITLLASSDYLLVVNNQLAARSLRELVDLAKSRPGQLSLGSAGTGTVTHLAGAKLNRQAGLDILHVPYKGAPQVVTDLIGGQISMTFNSVATLAPTVRAGKLRAIAVAAPSRAALLADVPTFAESGLTGFEVKSWFGLLTTARVPAGVITRLQTQAVRALNSAETRERIVGQGLDPIGSTPAQFAAFIRQEIATYAQLGRESGLRLD